MSSGRFGAWISRQMTSLENDMAWILSEIKIDVVLWIVLGVQYGKPGALERFFELLLIRDRCEVFGL